MANALFDAGKQALLTGGINWVSDDIRVLLVNITAGNYVVDLANHSSLVNVGAGSRVSNAITIPNRTATAGTADGDDLMLTGVTSGVATSALIIYKHTGTESTSTLIAYIDSAVGLTTATDGSDVQVTWDSGANKIFTI